MPNEYARAVHELVQAKVEQRAPEIEIETKGRAAQGHQHHGRAQEEHADQGTDESQGCGAQANGKGRSEAAAVAINSALSGRSASDCTLVFAQANSSQPISTHKQRASSSLPFDEPSAPSKT